MYGIWRERTPPGPPVFLASTCTKPFLTHNPSHPNPRHTVLQPRRSSSTKYAVVAMSSNLPTTNNTNTSSSSDPPPVISPSAAKRPRTMTTTPPPTIHLTAIEAQLFDLLKQAVAQANQGTVLRVAGGWVRDKLLGKESDDVDMALDNVSGAAFAESLNAFLQQQGIETRSIGVIQANPDQSKHLETARVLVLGHWIDFTNLRTETYRADSRIPEMAFGSAHDDAHRRDFTINALFYNLLTDQVEDLTGKGLDDLLGPKGVIRTPLPALTTFLDDPLRLLRAVRFAGRFALPLHESIVEAAKDEELQRALYEKVSRERVGIEIEGMLSGKDARPALALEMILSLGLVDVVFWLPDEVKAQLRPEGGREGWAEEGLGTVRMVNVLLMHREESGSVDGKEEEQQEITMFLQDLRESDAYKRPRREHRLLFLSAMLRGWAGFYTVDEKKMMSNKDKEREREKRVSVVQWFIREALKLRAKDAEDMAMLLGALDRLQALSSSIATTTTTTAAAAAAAAAAMGTTTTEEEEGEKGGRVEIDGNGGEQRLRLQAGLLLRELKDLWRTGLDLACAREMAILTEKENSSAATTTTSTGGARSRILEVLTRYQRTREALEAMGLDQIWTLRPLLDGKAVITLLSLPKGPMVGQVMEAQFEWQLQHPQGSVEELTEHLKGLVAAGAFAGAVGAGGVAGGGKKG